MPGNAWKAPSWTPGKAVTPKGGRSGCLELMTEQDTHYYAHYLPPSLPLFDGQDDDGCAVDVLVVARLTQRRRGDYENDTERIEGGHTPMTEAQPC